MNEKVKKKRFIYSIFVLVFITLSGGLQDSYAYFFRDAVFANAQTGNVVFLSVYLIEGDFQNALRYIIPIFFFILGVIISRVAELKGMKRNTFLWRQIVLFFEALVLFLVGFIPQTHNIYANALVSFVAAMQLEAFRSIKGHHFASTMCIGNMVKGASALTTGVIEKNKKALLDGLFYFGIIALFGLGASIGYVLLRSIGEYAIWVSSVFLLLSIFFLHHGFEE